MVLLILEKRAHFIINFGVEGPFYRQCRRGGTILLGKVGGR